MGNSKSTLPKMMLMITGQERSKNVDNTVVQHTINSIAKAKNQPSYPLRRWRRRKHLYEELVEEKRRDADNDQRGSDRCLWRIDACYVEHWWDIVHTVARIDTKGIVSGWIPFQVHSTNSQRSTKGWCFNGCSTTISVECKMIVKWYSIKSPLLGEKKKF